MQERQRANGRPIRAGYYTKIDELLRKPRRHDFGVKDNTKETVLAGARLDCLRRRESSLVRKELTTLSIFPTPSLCRTGG